jgi:methionine-gamma-lyase
MEGKKLKLSSRVIHSGAIKEQYKSVTVPIYQTSTFAFENVDQGAKCFTGEIDGFIYSRIDNPTVRVLEKDLAALENGEDGIATSSGMAAVTTLYMALLGQGAHMISTDAVYGPSRGVMEDHFSRFGVESSYINTADPANIIKAIKPNTKLLYIETPANPTMEITDISECAKIAHEHGILVAVDNTFCSPYLQRPLDLGADIVIHSMTKFINGHADIVGGIIVVKDPALYKKVRAMMIVMGCCIDAHQAYLVMRGMKTLAIRIDRAQENAMKVASYLEKHPKVEWVKYPGLKSHPQYELAKRQMDGPGSMICFELKGGLAAGKVLLNNVKVAILAVSLGGVETLIQHPASMTHSKTPAAARLKAGITDGLVRYSVGIEDVEDLINDLEQALNKI